jgi:hypothetical protein
MCFSAEASFVTSAALLPVGAYCLARAVRKDRRYFPLALVPFAFSAQQFAEGLVWLGLRWDDAVLVRRASQVFLFFALAFWPFWVPFSFVAPQDRPQARRILGGLTALSLVWFWLYYPLVSEPDRLLSTQVLHHSIRYDFDELPAFGLFPRNGWRLAYLVFVCGPFAVPADGRAGWNPWLLGTGALLAALFLTSFLFFWYAFTSVWCFFAAVFSVLLCALFGRLPARVVSPAPAACVSRGAGL